MYDMTVSIHNASGSSPSGSSAEDCAKGLRLSEELLPIVITLTAAKRAIAPITAKINFLIYAYLSKMSF